MNKRTELVKAIVILPGSVLVLIPGVLLYLTRPVHLLFGVPFSAAWFLAGSALLFTAGGFWFAIKTVTLFVTAGEGTPAPWAPPQKFVVSGPYRYVRNPMILSALSILMGEAILFGSFPVLIWGILFWMINTIYFSKFEEPGLVKRFGNDYLEYQKNVRRWIPRLTPWNPREKQVHEVV